MIGLSRAFRHGPLTDEDKARACTLLDLRRVATRIDVEDDQRGDGDAVGRLQREREAADEEAREAAEQVQRAEYEEAHRCEQLNFYDWMYPAAQEPGTPDALLSSDSSSPRVPSDNSNTRQAAQYIHPPDTWLGELERACRPKHEVRAVDHDAIASSHRARLGSGALAGKTVKAVRRKRKVTIAATTDAESKMTWHRQRANGLRHRFPRAKECGRGIRVTRCANRHCHVVHHSPLYCNNVYVCVPCRDRDAARKRPAIKRAMDSCVGEAVAAKRITGYSLHDEHAERFLTLTIDDSQIIGPLAPRRRTGLIHAAWGVFKPKLNRYIKKEFGDKAVLEFTRQYEVTPGFDALSHPHFHVWMLCPFIPYDRLNEWWARAVESAAAQLGETYSAGVQRFSDDGELMGYERCIIEIHQIKGGMLLEQKRGAMANELVKRPRLVSRGEGVANYIGGWWLQNDDPETGLRMSAETIAEIEDTLVHFKKTVSSRGFMARGKLERACEGCKSTEPMKVDIIQSWSPRLPAELAALGAEYMKKREEGLRRKRPIPCALRPRVAATSPP